MARRPTALHTPFRLFFKYVVFLIFACVVVQLALHHQAYQANRTSMNIQETILSIIQIRFNVDPIESDHQAASIERDQICQVSIPSQADLDYNNVYWQHFESSNGTFYLYHAYHDVRRSTRSFPIVRILSMINRLSPPRLFCQIWFHNSTQSLRTTAYYHHIWHSRWENYRNHILQPYLINCPVTRGKGATQFLHPKSVSIYENPCQKLTNHLPIDPNYFHEMNNGKKDTFAVCVKGLDFPKDDLSLRLIEWIELLKLLGVNRISFYQYDVHSNISAVLKYYENQRFIHLESLSLPGMQPNIHAIRRAIFKHRVTVRRQHELIPYNDCFYRHMYHYQYVVLLDIDEIIMPRQDTTWTELFRRLKAIMHQKRRTYTTFSARNVYFFTQPMPYLARKLSSSSQRIFEQIPDYFHMLKQVERSAVYTKPYTYVKTFFDSDLVIAVHNHYAMGCFGPCYRHEINTSLAHLQHYRDDCVAELRKKCDTFRKNSTHDTAIWKYRHSLIREAMKVAKQLNLVRSKSMFSFF